MLGREEYCNRYFYFWSMLCLSMLRCNLPSRMSPDQFPIPVQFLEWRESVSHFWRLALVPRSWFLSVYLPFLSGPARDCVSRLTYPVVISRTILVSRIKSWRVSWNFTLIASTILFTITSAPLDGVCCLVFSTCLMGGIHFLPRMGFRP